VLKVITRYPWEAAYEAAILETEHSRLSDRIKAAQTAINSRIEQMQQDRGTPEERDAIASALAGIRVLKNEVA
jgi:hypothetical protein